MNSAASRKICAEQYTQPGPNMIAEHPEMFWGLVALPVDPVLLLHRHVPMLEEYLRPALLLSRGSFSIFFTRPISARLLGLVAIFVTWQTVAFFVKARRMRAFPRAEDELAPAEH